ncbi:hypothetical protein [Serratia fonticola]
MSRIHFEQNRQGDIAITIIKCGGIEATIEQVGKCKAIKSQGRGSVRQAKAIARAIHKIGQ